MLLHADDAILVIDKPAGLLAVPGRGDDKRDSASLRMQAMNRLTPRALAMCTNSATADLRAPS